MEKKTVVVTGSNRGIGLEFCKIYKSAGYRVIAVCRHGSAELSELDIQTIQDINVTELDCIKKLQKELQGITIDILINNAGLLTNETLHDMNYDRIERQFATNAMGPLRVTHALLDNLKNGSKLALITSRMGSIADNTSGSRYGYRMSKAALNAAGMSLAQDLKHENIAVAILHPGYVQTGMTGYTGDITPDEAARRLYQRIKELTIKTTGSFWHSNGEILDW